MSFSSIVGLGGIPLTCDFVSTVRVLEAFQINNYKSGDYRQLKCSKIVWQHYIPIGKEIFWLRTTMFFEITKYCTLLSAFLKTDPNDQKRGLEGWAFIELHSL